MLRRTFRHFVPRQVISYWLKRLLMRGCIIICKSASFWRFRCRQVKSADIVFSFCLLGGRIVGFTYFLNKQKGLSMVVIRLARGGSKKRPFYTVVAADSKVRRDGRFIERLGFYTPVGAEGQENLRIELDRVQHWVDNGAQVSPTVRRLVKEYRKPVEAAV